MVRIVKVFDRSLAYDDCHTGGILAKMHNCTRISTGDAVIFDLPYVNRECLNERFYAPVAAFSSAATADGQLLEAAIIFTGINDHW